MSVFDYKKNRIFNGVCEWCGIKAVECPHYKHDPKLLPLDEVEREAKSPNAPPEPKKIYVPPLTEEEKSESLADSLAAKREYEVKNASTKLNDPTGVLDDEDEEGV